ncbi:GMC oxidoreductase-domain-containing protein [Rhodofomes roseus]|uniref:GMC oxidoreductase-domain-containing protein n=1 Tax=Rhodofomes roseus TaxID=34475 RepID=A0ABQ8KWI5_9APHY|nr:GMC oxidoreductase-domain-containing protein [Rhodofomes roseus]KAH9843571.1 GMC oxidoreductase-domain-containing protein [Rhodofomes roseus]
MWPFTSSYPQKSLHALRAQYDFIVAPRHYASLLHAPYFHRQAQYSLRQCYDERLGRTSSLITGVGLGGTSRINADMYTCGAPSQYNAWHEQGRIGWSFDDMKPYFMKSQNWTGPVPREFHGLIEHLREMDVPVIKHAPGVGNHLQDHVLVQSTYNFPMPDSLMSTFRSPIALVRGLYKYLRYGVGSFLCFLVETEIFSLSSVIAPDGTPRALSAEQWDPFDPRNVPDICIMISTTGNPNRPEANKSRGTIGIDTGLMLPSSTGQLCLRSNDPRANPVCDMRYATSPADRLALRAALRVSVAIARQLRADGYELDNVNNPDTSSDAALDGYIDKNHETMYHYTSTCRMAPETDEHPGVVDELCVHSIQKLRRADASVFPNCPAAHPQAVVYAFAERCADLILQAAASFDASVAQAARPGDRHRW